MNKGNFSVPIETLRGIAALMVAIGHSFIALKIGGMDLIWITPLWKLPNTESFLAKIILLLGNGTAAVVIFFVLSGFVLSLSLAGKSVSLNEYFFFLIRRVLRIYPAHALVITIIFSLLWFFSVANPGNLPESTTWFNWFYTYTPDLSNALSNIYLGSTNLNSVTWTLQVEVAAAILFPFMFWVTMKLKTRTYHVIFLVALVGLADIFVNVFYISHLYQFYAGILIYRYKNEIVNFIYGFDRISIFVFPAIFLLLAPNQFTMNAFAFQSSMTVGASIIICVIYARPPQWMSSITALRLLGKYSYSFYLWHFPVAWSIYFLILKDRRMLPGIDSLILSLAVCITSITLAFLLARFTFLWVEKPGVFLAKKLIGSIERK